jgi:anti-sigma regulatory factor (Ser/Thr protein kinase)
MTPARAPRYRVCVYELRDDKTTQVIETYGSGFITAVATADDDTIEVRFWDGGPRHLQEHIAAAIADEHSTRRPR